MSDRTPEYRGPVLLTTEHRTESFDCGDASLNQWLRRRALRNQGDGSSRTWVVTLDDRVVGYYASSAAALARSEVPGRMRRNQPDPLPAMLLGRLAVDSEHQGRGLAGALLKHFLLKSLEVAQLTGLRLVLVHAKDRQVANFYAHFGFESSPFDDLTLMLLIKDIQSAALA
ncbi:MAG: GNAT family N-acetyltransferase [Chloroflexota bacterium]|nr:GNAT family N-acetyltransferase [Chloroflexota bacterium]